MNPIQVDATQEAYAMAFELRVKDRLIVQLQQRVADLEAQLASKEPAPAAPDE